jgi:hypothetical protein
MKTGRIQTLGGIQYSTSQEVQTSPFVGADAPYINPTSPSLSTVGDALDQLLESTTSRYMEVQDTPYLVMRGGDYVCLPGSNTLYLGNGMSMGEVVSISSGVELWTVRSSSIIRVGDKVGQEVTALEEGCSITLLMTSLGWICTHLLGNVDILLLISNP